MLWFRKSSEEEDSPKRRRRRSSRSSSSNARRRGTAGDRRSGSERGGGRRSRRATSRDRRDTPREDTRDRDDRRKAASRDRTVAKEQAEVFEAINFDGRTVEPDEVDRSFARLLNVSFYVLLGMLVTGLVVYAVGRGMDARQAARIAPLQGAAVDGDVDVLRALLADGVPVDGVGPEGGTALSSAIRAGRLESVRLLLDGGAEPSDDAIRLAMRYEHWDILATLVEAGGNPDARDGWSGRSLLELAVERRDIDMTHLLLTSGADAGAVSHEGPAAQPALHFAAQNGLDEFVELLLEHGADPQRSWMGSLPRQLASESGHPEIARRLARVEDQMRGPTPSDE